MNYGGNCVSIVVNYLINILRFGRGMFNHLQKIVQFSENVDWRWLRQVFFKLSFNLIFVLLRMVAFDVPSKAEEHLPFEERYGLLLPSLSADHPFVVPNAYLLTLITHELKVLAVRMRCFDKGHLETFVKEIINHGGEGAILQAVHSVYERGRSSSVLKLKVHMRFILPPYSFIIRQHQEIEKEW